MREEIRRTKLKWRLQFRSHPHIAQPGPQPRRDTAAKGWKTKMFPEKAWQCQQRRNSNLCGLKFLDSGPKPLSSPSIANLREKRQSLKLQHSKFLTKNTEEGPTHQVALETPAGCAVQVDYPLNSNEWFRPSLIHVERGAALGNLRSWICQTS
jgi:hypothetical protein